MGYGAGRPFLGVFLGSIFVLCFPMFPIVSYLFPIFAYLFLMCFFFRYFFLFLGVVNSGPIFFYFDPKFELNGSSVGLV